MTTPNTHKTFIEEYSHAQSIWDNWDRALLYDRRDKVWVRPKCVRKDYSLNELNNPEVFKLAPVKKLVPFDHTDIRSNMWFKHSPNGPNTTQDAVNRKVVARDTRGIYMVAKDIDKISLIYVTWVDLFFNWVYTLDGDDSNKEYKCQKEVEDTV